MEAPARLSQPPPLAVVFEDGLGQRVRLPDSTGGSRVEVLTLRASFATVPSFEFTLRERAAQLLSLQHPHVARIRSVERFGGTEPLLRVVSDAAPGLRLSALMADGQARHVALDINAALSLVRQMVTAVAALHERPGRLVHGAIGPERLVVSPQGRLMLVEHVLGGALEQLRYSRERYWRELRIPLEPGDGPLRFDQRTDVLQMGIVSLALVLGRALRPEEYPARVPDIVASTSAVSLRGTVEPMPPGLRGWLLRALHLDPTRTFESAVDALAELDDVLGPHELVASPASLEAYLSRYHATEAPPRVSQPPSPAPAPSPPMQRRPDVGASWPGPGHTEDIVSLAAPLTVTRRSPAKLPRVVKPAAAADVPLPSGRVADVQRSRARRWPLMGALAAVALIVVAGAVAMRPGVMLSGRMATPGTLELSSEPSGVEAFVDGQRKGTTPIVLKLEPGSHRVELRGQGRLRTIPITIKAGMTVSQSVVLPRTRTVPASRARTPAAAALPRLSGSDTPIVIAGLPPLPVGRP